jgi:large subunit ribosomal protein L32e
METQITTRKKRKFIRYKSINQVKLHGGWRRARGMHNKVRLKKKGHLHKVSIGYGTKKEIMNLYGSKFDYQLIKSLNDLNRINKKYILISRSIGLKKKIEIFKKAKELGLNVIRIKDIDSFLKNIQDKLNQNKQKKEKKQQKREIYQKKAEEKSKEKKEIKEEKIEQEKEEKRRVLEAKQ